MANAIYHALSGQRYYEQVARQIEQMSFAGKPLPPEEERPAQRNPILGQLITIGFDLSRENSNAPIEQTCGEMGWRKCG